MDAIQLHTIETTESAIRCSFDYPNALNKFFVTDTHVVEYETPVGDVPEGIRPIPWLASIATLAWATGVDVELPVLDERYYESLKKVERAFQQMYPEFIEGSEIRCETLTEPTVERTEFDQTALLFSGGVDAFATYLRHRDEEPSLVGIRGFDVDEADSNAWAEKRDQIESFARSNGLASHFVKTNMMSILDNFMINAQFKRFIESDWYDSVQHGLALTGLCAPVAFSERFGRLYMADSASEAYDVPVGNHPDIINNVAWSHTSVRSDGFELTRQEKIELLADAADGLDFRLHTCLQPGPGNCNECEKCLRTSFGVLLAGIDPNQYGYQLDDGSYKHAYKQLKAGNWKLGQGQLTDWKELRERARGQDFERPAAKAFFDWLNRTDLDRLGTESDSGDFLAYKISRRLPPSANVQSLRRRVLDVVW